MHSELFHNLKNIKGKSIGHRFLYHPRRKSLKPLPTEPEIPQLLHNQMLGYIVLLDQSDSLQPGSNQLKRVGQCSSYHPYEYTTQEPVSPELLHLCV